MVRWQQRLFVFNKMELDKNLLTNTEIIDLDKEMSYLLSKDDCQTIPPENEIKVDKITKGLSLIK